MKAFKMYYKPENEETVKNAINNADALKKLVEKRVVYIEELEINQESEEQKEHDKFVNDIIKNSATTEENAKKYLSYSNDYKRDSLIIKNLSNKGFDVGLILEIIIDLNDEI